MKRCIVGGLTVVLMAAELIAAAPANAGCLSGGLVISKCDGPIQPDGTWQRCVEFAHWIYNGTSSYMVPERQCDELGPGQHPFDLAFADPPTHIDD